MVVACHGALIANRYRLQGRTATGGAGERQMLLHRAAEVGGGVAVHVVERGGSIEMP